MVKNPPTGDGHRKGAVRNRSQVFNPKTGTWTKRDAETGQFMDQKQDGTPFKRGPEGKEVGTSKTRLPRRSLSTCQYYGMPPVFHIVVRSTTFLL